MISHGTIVIAHEGGWSCAKEATLTMEFDLRPDNTAKRTIVISVSGLFTVLGNPSDSVTGIFKFEDGKKIGFSGILYKKSRIEVIGETHDNFETILKDIKKWQEYYKVS